MIDSEVILRDIFCDNSVNVLCTYPLLYTAGMCDVTYIRVRNIYLHGKCFLSALYKDIICLTSPQSTLLFVSSDSSSHAYAISRNSSLSVKPSSFDLINLNILHQTTVYVASIRRD